MSEGIIKNELNPGEKRGSARFLLFSGGIPGVSGHLPPLWKQNDTIRVPKTGLSNVKMGLNASTKSAKIKKGKLLRRFQRSDLNGGSVSPDLFPSTIFHGKGVARDGYFGSVHTDRRLNRRDCLSPVPVV